MSREWCQHYDAGVPASLAPYPHRTLLDYIAASAADHPTHPAVLFKGGCLSCGELERLSTACAAALVRLGVRKGDRVALVLPNCPQFLIAEVGAWKAGAVVCPLNPLYTEQELAEALRDSGAEIAVVLTPFYTRIKACQPRTVLRHVVATNIKEYLPSMMRLLFSILKEKKGGHRITIAAGDSWLQDLLASAESLSAPSSRPSPEDPAVMLMSGGTTGTAKAVVGLHRCLVIAGLQIHAWLSPGSIDGEDIFMVPLPLFHVYACVGVQSHAFIGRNPLALIPNPRDLDDLLKTIERVRPAFLSSVPTLFVAMLGHPKVRARKIDFSSIKVCFSGAAPLLAETKRRFEEMTKGHIVEGYSLTEAMMACTGNPLNGVNKTGSVGVPLPDVEVAVVDADTGRTPLAAGEIGEIIVRAPQLMASYWRKPDETSHVLRSYGPGGPWLYTGDLGYFDEDGYLFIIDRKKDLIKTSGYQVWPREVEEVIATHHAVAEVGVGGVPDAVKGEAVKAWIVCRPGMSVTSAQVRAHCLERLAPYKVPVQVEFRAELPKTITGKVLRRALTGGEVGQTAGQPADR